MSTTGVSPTSWFVPKRQRLTADAWVMRALSVGIVLWLVVGLVLPLGALMSKSMQDSKGRFVGLDNFAAFFATPSLVSSIEHSFTIAMVTTVICTTLAFIYAYALTRSCMPLKGLLKATALIKLLVPSLLTAIAVRFALGNQGVFNWIMGGQSIYGPIGIVIGHVIFTFPYALLILMIALSSADARLYESAVVLGARPVRIFFSVTLPGIKYGLASASIVVFTLSITDFGVPKITGGQYNVLATDVYKKVVGQQNFEMGAVIGVILLIPAVVAFLVDYAIKRRAQATVTSGAVAYRPKPSRIFDFAMFGYCACISSIIVGLLVLACWASFIKYWPYDFSFTLDHYDFTKANDYGWDSYWNSVRLAFWTMTVGTAVVFFGAYLAEKGRGAGPLRAAIHFLSMLPLAVPGLVLGISYVFFFVRPGNPLNFIYGTMTILVVSTIIHYYPVSHLISTTALKHLDPEFESVAASLRAPFYRPFWSVTVPVCMPAILEVSMFLFLSAMTTTSAVIFLYAPSTAPAAVAIINMDDAGLLASAAAMGAMVFFTSAVFRLLHWLVTRKQLSRTQAWRQNT